MDAITYLSKRIVGQDRLRPNIAMLMENIKNGSNLNIIIRGPSGYGKTHLARVIYNYVDAKATCVYLGESAYNLQRGYRIHVLDEAHEIRTPEILYPDMDSQRYTFLILTNEFGELKEPLVNRCLPINLSPYTLDDLALLVYITLQRKGYLIDQQLCQVTATYCRGNPRVAKNIAKQLAMLFSKLGNTPTTVEELVELLQVYLSLNEGGFTELDQRYLEFLTYNSPAGIDTISNYLCIPKQVLLMEVEPFLIRGGLVKITSRGRIRL